MRQDKLFALFTVILLVGSIIAFSYTMYQINTVNYNNIIMGVSK